MRARASYSFIPVSFTKGRCSFRSAWMHCAQARRPVVTGLAQTLADAVDALLPQTQCGQCGYAACRPYAEAIARGDVDINRCAPGADESIAEIAALLGVPPKPLDPRFGVIKPAVLAVIDEAQCIGCALCIKACPVDAIVGAPKLMHTVLEPACTGCELCVPPCPVDCIRMEPGPARDRGARQEAAAAARRRFEARTVRLERTHGHAIALKQGVGAEMRKKATIAKAIERARERLKRANRDP